MANLADAMEKYVREELSPTIRDATWEVAPSFKNILSTSIGVERSGLGRDWKAKHIFLTSLAGAIKAEGDSAIEGDTLAYGTGAGEPGVVYAQSATWPGIGSSVAPGYTQKELQLKRWKGNMFVPHDLLRADQMSASLLSALTNTVKQTARNVAYQRASNFFAVNSYKALGVVSSASISNGTATIVLDSTSRIRKFQPGMLVDIIDYNGGAYDQKCNNASYPVMIVKSVDPTAKTVVIEHVSSSGTSFAYNPAASDLIVLKDSFTIAGTPYGHGPKGPAYWLVASGTVYGMNLAHYPQFKSVVSAVSATLTDTVLRNKLGAFYDTHPMEQWPDTILTTSGVIADYVGEIDDLRRFQVQGTAAKVRGGFGGGIGFEYDGRFTPFTPETLMPSGYAWIMKMGGKNIKRYVPPSLPGASGDKAFPGDVEFVAPLGGSKGIWMHTYDTDSNLTPYLQAPYEIIEEYCPEVLPGIVLTGLTEYTS